MNILRVVVQDIHPIDFQSTHNTMLGSFVLFSHLIQQNYCLSHFVRHFYYAITDSKILINTIFTELNI
jgi:hypothetical protein